MKSNKKQEALDYHSVGRPGKIEVIPSVATKTQRDLSLAYSPGVAEPCLAIAENPKEVYKYTSKGNLVAVITNGTAVLGLGDIGPEASKPVMEGKGILFKIFADIDVFDLEVNATSDDAFIDVVKALEPTFGGINLEDIAAPSCFYIEKRLKKETDIPVMHDDQHGTAIISGAALLNALELVDKKIDEIKIVTSGAGAAALSCVQLYVSLGVKPENITLTDKGGVIHTEREDLDEFKLPFAKETTARTLNDVIADADMFLGLSVGNVFKPEMLLKMAKNPIVFALANPVPEMDYKTAVKTRSDVIMATGRSDYPNQVNNVLGFPFIFRGALDVQSKEINEAMKLAAVKAIAQLAKEPVPDIVRLAYGNKNFQFGKEYIIPKPLDRRLLTTIAPAVAKAAVASGVARISIDDWEAYEEELVARMGNDEGIMRTIARKARLDPKRVLMVDSENYKTLQAAQIVVEEGIAKPILLGNKKRIEKLADSEAIDLNGIEILDTASKEYRKLCEQFGNILFEKRKRKGLNLFEARNKAKQKNYFGSLMVDQGMADGMISGLQEKYADVIRPALQVIGVDNTVGKVASMYIMLTKRGPLFFADTTVNLSPTSEDLIKITQLTAEAVKRFNIEPRIAMLSYSNFGDFDREQPKSVQEAVSYLHQYHPEIIVDGEMQANYAFNKELLREHFPFSPLVEKGANTLIFPTLASGNIAYKILQEVGQAEAIGPILMGLKKPIHILQLGASVREIVNMITYVVVDAQD